MQKEVIEVSDEEAHHHHHKHHHHNHHHHHKEDDEQPQHRHHHHHHHHHHREEPYPATHYEENSEHKHHHHHHSKEHEPMKHSPSPSVTEQQVRQKELKEALEILEQWKQEQKSSAIQEFEGLADDYGPIADDQLHQHYAQIELEYQKRKQLLLEKFGTQ